MNVKKDSKKQEKRIAEEFKGRTQIASGALWASKGDVRSSDYLIEAKRTDKDNYRLTAVTWNKIRTEAIRDGLREPLLAIEIQGLNLIVLNDNSETVRYFDKSYKLVTLWSNGSNSIVLHRAIWDSFKTGPMQIPSIVVNFKYRDKDTACQHTFKLRVLKEEDFHKLVGG